MADGSNPPAGLPAYEYRHLVTFEDTNVVGNVYYVNHLKWQGKCRELFVRDHAPGLLSEIEQGLVIVTTRCSCDYQSELHAFDEVVVRMRIGRVTPSTMVLRFEYVRVTDADEIPVASGEQRLAFMRRQGSEMLPTPIPESLKVALEDVGIRVPSV